MNADPVIVTSARRNGQTIVFVGLLMKQSPVEYRGRVLSIVEARELRDALNRHVGVS